MNIIIGSWGILLILCLAEAYYTPIWDDEELNTSTKNKLKKRKKK